VKSIVAVLLGGRHRADHGLAGALQLALQRFDPLAQCRNVVRYWADAFLNSWVGRGLPCAPGGRFLLQDDGDIGHLRVVGCRLGFGATAGR
jgi:hypothetical protein